MKCILRSATANVDRKSFEQELCIISNLDIIKIMDDDIGLESVSFPFDPYLNVRGLLRTHYGLEHGTEIYDLLKRTAEQVAEDMSPGIVFDEDGGEFVGVETT